MKLSFNNTKLNPNLVESFETDQHIQNTIFTGDNDSIVPTIYSKDINSGLYSLKSQDTKKYLKVDEDDNKIVKCNGEEVDDALRFTLIDQGDESVALGLTLEDGSIKYCRINSNNGEFVCDKDIANADKFEIHEAYMDGKDLVAIKHVSTDKYLSVSGINVLCETDSLTNTKFEQRFVMKREYPCKGLTTIYDEECGMREHKDACVKKDETMSGYGSKTKCK